MSVSTPPPANGTRVNVSASVEPGTSDAASRPVSIVSRANPAMYTRPTTSPARLRINVRNDRPTVVMGS